jgi:carbamoylphosphate synthase large subunit
LSLADTTPRTVRVIIFGDPGRRWRSALGPGAAVWERIPEVRDVVHVDDVPDLVFPRAGPADSEDVIIPLFENHTRQCPTGYRSLIPNNRALRTFGHKGRFAAYLRRHGLSALSPAVFRDEAEAEFPCVLKSARLGSGRGVAIVRSASHVRELLELEPFKGQDHVLQALVGGAREYVTHCVCRAGVILWSCSFAYDLDEADIIRTQSNSWTMRPCDVAPQILAQISRLLEPIGYTGPCNLDYKLGEDGTIAVFEINPRLGGSLMSPENVAQLADALACIIRHAA